MAETNLAALAERQGINTMVDLINKDVNSEIDIKAFRADLYYDRMMLDKIKLTEDNYIFLQYAKTYPIPKGHAKWTIRRPFPLTEHTVPLLEGIPPKSDKTKRERIEGSFHQYGRYMEFSDRVEWTLLDPLMMEYASEYGDVATRTMHRLARKELLNSTMKVYANSKTNIGELEVGDTVGLADFRLTALKLSRLAVQSIGGVYHVITSEEHFWDLMKDPLIIEYLGSDRGLPHYKDGSLPELFGIKFIKTQFDDFAYGYELGNPGEWSDGSSDYCRVYGVTDGGNYVYGNLASSKRTTYAAEEYKSNSDFGYDSRAQEEGLDDMSSAEDATEAANRLADGSWIPIRNIWTLDYTGFLGTDMAAALSADQATKTLWGSIYYTYDHTGGTVEKMFTLYVKYGTDSYETLGYLVTTDSKLTAAAIATAVAAETVAFPTVKQVPVHRAILLGQDALAKLEVTGEGNVKMYAKPKGSAGVLDPIDQRQSIGFKINTIGFKLIRDEACWVYYHVPTQAVATAGISL